MDAEEDGDDVLQLRLVACVVLQDVRDLPEPCTGCAWIFREEHAACGVRCVPPVLEGTAAVRRDEAILRDAVHRPEARGVEEGRTRSGRGRAAPGGEPRDRERGDCAEGERQTVYCACHPPSIASACFHSRGSTA